MSKKRRNSVEKVSDLTDSGVVALTEEELSGVEGGTNRLGAGADDDDQAENVTINFAKVKYVYTPQK